MKTVIHPLARRSSCLRCRTGSRLNCRVPVPPIRSPMELVWRTRMHTAHSARKASGFRKMSPASGPRIIHRHTHLTQQIFSAAAHYAQRDALPTANTHTPHRMVDFHRIERLVSQSTGGAGRVTASATIGKLGGSPERVRVVGMAGSKPGTQQTFPPGPPEAASRTTGHRQLLNRIGWRAFEASAFLHRAEPTSSAYNARSPSASTQPPPPRHVGRSRLLDRSGFRFRIQEHPRVEPSNSKLFTRGAHPSLIRHTERRSALASQTPKLAVGGVTTEQWRARHQIERPALPSAVEKVWQTSASVLRDITPLSARAPMPPAHHDAVAPQPQAAQPPVTPHCAASTNMPLDRGLVERLTDEVARNIEKRLRIERERRGL